MINQQDIKLVSNYFVNQGDKEQFLHLIEPISFALLGLESCGKSTFLREYLQVPLGVIQLNVGTKCPFVYHVHPIHEYDNHSGGNIYYSNTITDNNTTGASNSGGGFTKLIVKISKLNCSMEFDLSSSTNFENIRNIINMKVTELISKYTSFSYDIDVFTSECVHLHLFGDNIVIPYRITDFPGMRLNSGSEFTNSIIGNNLSVNDHILLFELMDTTVGSSNISGTIEKLLIPNGLKNFSIVKTKVDRSTDINSEVFNGLFRQYHSKVNNIYCIAFETNPSKGASKEQINDILLDYQNVLSQSENPLHQSFFSFNVNLINNIIETDFKRRK